MDAGRPGPVDPRRPTTLRPLPFEAVRLDDGHLGRLQRANGETSVPRGAAHLDRVGAYRNFDDVASGAPVGSYYGPFFEDGEVYKYLEAASWEAGRSGDAELAAYVGRATARLAAAQDADGYLNTFVQRGRRSERFGRLDTDHEIFNVGALVQSAVARHRATGKDDLLAVARRAADQLDATFGPGRRDGTCGHPLAEMALVELYRTTGEARYLELARRFVEVRGHGVLEHPDGPTRAYLSDRVPVRATTVPEGHAVRAVYLAAGATDVATETGDAELLAALEQQWEAMVGTKTYLTGGLGSRWDGEAFGDPYELPSDRAYAETCAAIASIQWSWRLLLATGDARYADLVERQLYNAVLPAVSRDGDAYFYVNALQVRDGAVVDDPRSPAGGRRPWFGVSCCPTNIMRTLASLHAYVATSTDDGVQLHQLTACTVDVELGGGRARLAVETGYPWDGRVVVTVEESPAGPWTLDVRIPPWAEGTTATVDGEAVPTGAGRHLSATRVWSRGARVELVLDVGPRLVRGHHRVDATRGCVAVERGPLVHAFEQVDNPGLPVDDLVLDAGVAPVDGPPVDDLGGVPTVRVAARTTDGEAAVATAVPYLLWANRAVGPMRVWAPYAAQPAPTVA